MCIFAFGGNLCSAQSNAPPPSIEWGRNERGVRLSITMTNRVVISRSSTVLTALITNSSTNNIVLFWSSPETDFYLSLTNNAGKSYLLTPHFIEGSTGRETIYPAGRKAEAVPVTFGSEIQPGDYTLKASRDFGLGGGIFRLESNPVKVQIEKGVTN